MNLGKLGLCSAGAIASIALILAACSSSSTTSGGTGDGGSSGTSGTSGSTGGCAPAKGTYNVTYTADSANSATCVSGSTLSGPEMVDPSDKDAGPGCEAVENGCKTTVTCSETLDGGVTNMTTIELDTPSDGAGSYTGSISVVTSGGGVNQSCKYTISATKQ
jgi:hypothetical protein